MSHKKKLSWYQLYLRIEKMRLGRTKSDPVQAMVDGKLYPVTLEFDKSGEVAYLQVNKP